MTEEKKAEKKPQLELQRIYTKDISCEVPNSPEIFTEKWDDPAVSLDINSTHTKLSGNFYEVVIEVTAATKIKDKTAFLVEVKQAGIFVLDNLDKDGLEYMLNSYCPSILFPYVRELVSDLVLRSGFPPLFLPINFDELYEEEKQEQKDSKDK